MPSYLQLDGIYSWHSTPRAVYSASAGTAGRTFFAFASDSDSGIWVGQYDHATGQTTSYRLGTSPDSGGDDHDHPSLLVLANGKILCAWTGHPGTELRIRTSTSAGDISAFDALVTVTDTGFTAYEYCSLAQLSSDNSGRIYLYYTVADGGSTRILHRRQSDDSGATWGAAGAFEIVYSPVSVGSTAYFEFSSNGTDRIDITMQPTQVAAGTPIGNYHFYHKFDSTTKYFKSDGTDITANLPFDASSDFTTIDDGTGYTSGLKNWGCFHNSGSPVALYVALTDNPITAHQYKMARWNGSAWTNKTVNIASGGSSTNYLVAAGQPQVYYSGGIDVNPANINEVLLSRNNSNFEIERWITTDSGVNWSKAEDMTTGGSTKRARPAYVHGTSPKITALYWAGTAGVANGGYTTYNNFRADLYALPVTIKNSLVAKDSFSTASAGTNLTTATYTLEAGRNWTLVTGTSPKVSSTGTCYGGATTASIVTVAGVPRTPNYRLACDVILKTKVTSDICGLEARTNGSASDTGYLLVADTSATNVYRLIRRVAGVSTTIATTNFTWTSGQTYNIALEVTGVGTTVNLKCYLDGVKTLEFDDTDASRIVTTGLVGLRFGYATLPGDTTGMHLDNFIVTDLYPTLRPGRMSGGISDLSARIF